MTEKPWSLDLALDLVRQIEQICPHYGCHVALTGGTLYKSGPRKDADILFYRIRQIDEIDVDGLFEALEDDVGLKRVSGWGWCIKAKWKGLPVDCFFPEAKSGGNGGGEYGAASDNDPTNDFDMRMSDD